MFNKADETLKFSITKLILEGPTEKLNETENTQPAIFLVGFSIFQLMKKDFGIDLNKASYFAGHSLGEYTALACAEVLGFSETLNLLRIHSSSPTSSPTSISPLPSSSSTCMLIRACYQLVKIIMRNRVKQKHVM